MGSAFRRIAIVNRGEPAMRFIRAARELRCEENSHISAIALYTECDARSSFVREADEAFSIGPATYLDPADGQRKNSYLNYARLLDALRRARADAVWVGWGFVAEHAEFADLCHREGIAFIGPSGAVMRRLGDKIASKLLAEEAGVPVSPWSGGGVGTLAAARDVARTIGYPLMIKATAGGGGRGIRRVTTEADLDAAFESASSEALKSFGDGTVFLEKAISNARHIEVQVLADNFGTIWPVGVRDCSVQRRNQKVIEEAPSLALSAAAAERISAAAVALARKANYRNAGTVEFLYEQTTQQFYFMEMNTRLQVEHPVTEMCTGVDLVKMQILVASGVALPADCPRSIGHAIEVRLNAEDPDSGFAPAPGRATLFRVPAGPGVRVDSGMSEGDVVAPEFDSMVAKIIAHGRDRREAIARLERALRETTLVLEGGTSNRSFLLELLANPDFQAGKVDIGWLDRLMVARDNATSLRPFSDIALLAAALEVDVQQRASARHAFLLSAARGQPRAALRTDSTVELRYQGTSYTFRVSRLATNTFEIAVGNQVQKRVVREMFGEHEGFITCDGRRFRVLTLPRGTDFLVEVDGVRHVVSRDDGGIVRSPAPSVVLAIPVKPGDVVARGDRVVVLEAMKMETSVLAPCGGRVQKILVSPNAHVAAGAGLVVIEPEREESSPSHGVEVVRFECSGTLSESNEDCAKEADAGLEILNAYLLGYDIDKKSVAKTVEQLTALIPWLWEHRLAQLTHVLHLFSALTALSERRKCLGKTPKRSAEECLLAFVRSPEAGLDEFPDEFRHQIGIVLAAQGVSDVAKTPDSLRDILFLTQLALQRLDDASSVVQTLLERSVPCVEKNGVRSLADLGVILDELVVSSQERFLAVHELARHVRFLCFDKPVFEERRQRVFETLERQLADLVSKPEGVERRDRLVSFVECAQPIVGFLMSKADENVHLRKLVSELLLLHFYRERRDQAMHSGQQNGVAYHYASFQVRDKAYHPVVTVVNLEELETILPNPAGLLGDIGAQDEVLLDVFVSTNALNEVTSPRLQEILSARNFDERVTRVCFYLSERGTRETDCYTFRRNEQGVLNEDLLLRGIHPMEAKRFELWRLNEFTIAREHSSSEDVFLYRMVSKENPKDVRLFAYAEVRDMTPRRDETGRIVELPEFERVFLEAASVMRGSQFTRPPATRAHWNRIVLNVVPPLVGQQRDLLFLTHKLQPYTVGLNLEKTVVRAKIVETQSGASHDMVMDITNEFDAGMRVSFARPSGGTVPRLSPYDQKVIQMRSRQMPYAYEIIRMMTPSRQSDHSDFPAGDFVELEMTACAENSTSGRLFSDAPDRRWELVPVQRQPGSNRANVVVGLIKNYTKKFPEGMERLFIAGDASREMGALTGEECKRILLALDLAEQRRIPVEWFPVSSGAKIAMDSGTENLDWTAAVLRRLIEFTEKGGTVHVVVTGINVGAQSYWNAEATMLMHTKGILVMTPAASMVLTGKRALDFSGGVSAEDNQGIGGAERIMGPNGQAQYSVRNHTEACQTLLAYYDHSYVLPGETAPRRLSVTDTLERDISTAPFPDDGASGFTHVGDIFSDAKNPGRKKPFDMRAVMNAVVDLGTAPLERWAGMRDAETGIVWDAHIGGIPLCLLGIESKTISRVGTVSADGPESWGGGTLYPLSSKKLARAINSASGNRPVVVLANLSGFDGSPESMRLLQLEYGAELGRAVVNCKSPVVFVVLSRFHGGAYVVFSQMLGEHVEVAAVEGSYASVIGGTPAAAVVFPGEVKARAYSDARIKSLQALVEKASENERPAAIANFEKVLREVYLEKQAIVAEEFDRVHSVERAQRMGSVHAVIAPRQVRAYIVSAIERGIRN